MTTMNQSEHLGSIRDQRMNVDRRHFRVIFVAAFMFYLIAFSFARLLPARWRSRFYGFERKRGVIAQASAQANILASYAIMS
jgi:hypothetical protein